MPLHIFLLLLHQEDKEALAQLPEAATALDEKLNGALTALISGESFKGAAKATASALLAGTPPD